MALRKTSALSDREVSVDISKEEKYILADRNISGKLGILGKPSMGERYGQSRSTKVGYFMAGSSAPRSFQRSLMPRDTTDQGLVTGLTAALSFVIGAIAQDSIETIANNIADNKSHRDKRTFVDSDKNSLLLSAGALVAGLAIQRLFSKRSDESMVNASIRTSGHVLSRVGIFGIMSQALEQLAKKASHNKPKLEADLVNSLIVPVGALIAVLADRIVYHGKLDKDDGNANIHTVKSVAIGTGVVSSLAGISIVERKSAHILNNLINKHMPVLANSWLPAGHIISLSTMVGGIYYAMSKYYKKLEQGAGKFDTNFKHVPKNRYVSGCIGSKVQWNTLSVEGRRHIGTRLSAHDIEKVTKQKSTEPIRIYIGLDSGENETERVKLALAELNRTKAYDKEYLVIISPTGSGYVNYVMSDTVEYMSHGNCAQVTMQYSKRPSPLSLDRRDEGHLQYRMLINGIKKQLQDIPVIKRPKVILFGESLGAWTSQDAFMYEGTDGFEASHIDKALWIGTPAESKWKDRALSQSALNNEKGTIGVFNSHDEYQALNNYDKNKLKYFMVTHYNDPVARFSPKLLIQAPDWLTIDSQRPPTIPKSNLFRVPGTFVQTLVDMKNALKPIPGQFVATGHDYRGDLAPFIRDIFDFKISNNEYNDILYALKANDKKRAQEI